jgi:hypothetical protein
MMKSVFAILGIALACAAAHAAELRVAVKDH